MKFKERIGKAVLTTINVAEDIVFASRWITIAPLAIALVVVTGIYEIKFFHELYEMVTHVKDSSLEQVMLSLLGMFDAFMVVNLAYTIKAGSWSIFIREVKDPTKKPRVLNHLSSGSLKVKMSTSLIGITGVHLLKDFIEADHLSWDTLWKRCLIHALFLVSTLALVVADQFTTHSPDPVTPNDKNKEEVAH